MNNTEIKNDIINFFKIFKDIDTKSNYNLVPDFNNFNDILDYFNFNKIFFFTEDIFFETFNCRQNKICFIEKKNKNKNSLHFYLRSNFNGQIVGIILFILKINKKYNMNPFPLKKISMKFRPRDKDNKIITLGTCYNKNFSERALLSYYIHMPYTVSKSNHFYNKNINESINLLINISNSDPIYNKLLFRGSNNNDLRNILFNTKGEYLDFKENDYIDFVDYTKYKYILDIWGINGHSGRRYWLLHMNRVIFLPIEDPNKLFFEIGENKILPNIHYVSYSVNKLNELNEKVKYFEDNPDEYKRIQNNCRDYCEKYLNYKFLETLVKVKLEEK